MEADAHSEFYADIPLSLDEGTERRVVGIRHVLLKAKGGGDVVNRHPEDFAEREHEGGRLGGRQTG